MVRGKKEKRYTSARVYIVLKAAIPLALLSDGMSRCSARISTKLCMILYIRTDLAFAICFVCRHHNPVISLSMTDHRDCNES